MLNSSPRRDRRRAVVSATLNRTMSLLARSSEEKEFIRQQYVCLYLWCPNPNCRDTMATEDS
jgi:hypothetical protein